MSLGLGVASAGATIDIDCTSDNYGLRASSDSSAQYATCLWGYLGSPTVGQSAAAVYGEVSGSLINPNGVAVRAFHLGPGIAVEARSISGKAVHARCDSSIGYAAYLLGRTYVSTQLGVGIEDPEAPIHAATTQQFTQINESSHASDWLNLTNTSDNGLTWSLVSTGIANGGGPGNLILCNHDDGLNVMLLHANGNVGIYDGAGLQAARQRLGRQARRRVVVRRLRRATQDQCFADHQLARSTAFDQGRDL